MDNIFTHTKISYSQYILSALGKGHQHAGLIYKEWFQKGSVTDLHPAFNNAKNLFKDIVAITDFSHLALAHKKETGQAEKFLLQTHDGLETESVVLPMKAGLSLCVSSQVGCRMGCAFCETGKMGLLRHLTTQEILSQIFHAKFSLGFDIRNIVFMGMGEPFDNYDELMRSIRVLCDPAGFGFGPSRITVSTSGLVDRIEQFSKEADPAINLAVSINAPNNNVRNKLMPVNHTHDMQRLYDAMYAYCEHPRRSIFIEYVLIKGYTDSLENIQQLAEYLKGLRVTINLIPYNPQTRGPFMPPDIQIINQGVEFLKQAGYRVFVRATKGQSIMAACGQLGNVNMRRKYLASKN